MTPQSPPQDANGRLKANSMVVSGPSVTKSVTEVRRYKELDGTYEGTLKEVGRRKLTTEDELIPLLAQMASEAQAVVQREGHLMIGRKDAYLVFAHSFIKYLKDDPYLFDDFLEEIKAWPREAKNKGSDLVTKDPEATNDAH